MFAIFLPVHILVSILLILVVLLQQAKGAGLSPVLGGGQSIFGARGASTFLSKLTAVLAVLFMVTSILLAISPKFRARRGGIEEELRKDLIPIETAPELPEGKTEPPPELPGGGQ